MKIYGLDLFSGSGGLSIALSPWVIPRAYCENDPYAQAVLLSRMRDGSLPWAPIWDDVQSLSGRMVPKPIDIVYGGFPCQDISVAGNGRGLEGKRSRLFSEVGRLVREINPAFVFLENVPAIRTRGAERVVKELASAGYDCRWTIVSAAEVGAPHKRERWFLLAYRDARFGDVTEASIQPRRISSEFRLQESLWSEDAAHMGRIHDGIPPIVHRIRAMGNAVVPIQAREAFKRLMGFKPDGD
jgi:DNA (cytosine-5)-methyltransferase 1